MTPELEPWSTLAYATTPEDLEAYRTARIENLDSIKLSLLRDTIGLGTNSTSTVSAVTVAIRVLAITRKVGEEYLDEVSVWSQTHFADRFSYGTPFELGMGGLNTSVNNVHTRARASTIVVRVGQRRTCFAIHMRDARQTPRRTALSHVCPLLEVIKFAEVGLDDSILLDVFDLRKD